MARVAPKKQVVVVGLGWAGSLMSMELANAGMDVLALERGDDRNTVPDFQYPDVADELRYGVRMGFMQKPRRSTVTIRNELNQTALPYRQLGAFLPGDGVGGAGIHWNGLTWRPMEAEFELLTHTEKNFGKNVIPEGMTIRDWGITYKELEPYMDRFEYVAGVSGQAGNVQGKIVPDGNPFEGPRARPYPLPPLPDTYDAALFRTTAKELGYHPFTLPASNASELYTNEYGMQLGPCNFCGFCGRYGCLNYSKASPQTCVLDALKRLSNFQYKTRCEVLKIEKSADGKTATGVTYFDEYANEEVFQPADIVILTAFQLHNVHLMLLSGIGEAYDPVQETGVVGRNYSYQVMGATRLFYKDKDFKPYMASGCGGVAIDDFSVGQNNFAELGFVGGSFFMAGTQGGTPILSTAVPAGTKGWGADWKQKVGDWYGHSMQIVSHGANMSYRDCYLDLDPTYQDRFGRPLMRMTFNWKPNDIRMTNHAKTKIEELAHAMQPDSISSNYMRDGSNFDVRPYQTTHTVGGAIMGADPTQSALNRFQQSWSVHNVFVVGANAFPQNTQYNPTGAVGALAYYAAEAILTRYIQAPRPLI
ncbi:GMC family oxidoreductase [Rhizobium nepotum]|uniref:GMC family oxidoreductase n=1 Tax=Rhizobium nepotum TaxID=1035271 RepID=UPI003CEF51AE